MAILPLVYEPEKILREQVKPVVIFDNTLQQLVNNMFETMYANNGCGLAAPQIGRSLALTVIDMSRKSDQKLVLANPEIIGQRGEHLLEAGCLSVPGVYAKIKRYAWVKVKAQDVKGAFFEVIGEGMLGECLQHEIDHLNGVLFIDRISRLKKKLLVEKSRKFRHKKKP